MTCDIKRWLYTGILLFGTNVVPIWAEEASGKIEFTPAVELVSNYVWRGEKLGGISVQPALEVEWKGVSFAAWSSVGFNRLDAKELDLTLSYQIGNLNVGVTDYFSTGEARFFQYKAHQTNHTIEGNVEYDFNFMQLSCNTLFAGADYYSNQETKRSYSTYLEVVVPFDFRKVEVNTLLGVTPFEGVYASKFAVVNIEIGVSRSFCIRENQSLNIFGKFIANPSTKSMYFVVGMGL